MTYETWMKEVDAEVFRILGVGVHDLSDFASRDAYESGIPAEDAAQEAIEGDDLAMMMMENIEL
jgi:hypothetical protein